MPSSQPTEAARPAEENDLLQRTIHGLLRACDAVFGATTVGLALAGVWLGSTGEMRATTVAALWAIPLFNLIWSGLTRNRDRVTAEIIRAIVSLPIATFLYVAEPTGLFEKLWLPSLVMTVGIALNSGIASRKVAIGCVVALAYTAALVGAAALRTHDLLAAAEDASGSPSPAA